MKDDVFTLLFSSDFLEEYMQYEEDEVLSVLSSKQLELERHIQSMPQEVQKFMSEYIAIQNQINRHLNCSYLKTGIKFGISLIKG